MEVDFENDFEVDLEALASILATRDQVLPYCVDFVDQLQDDLNYGDIETWLKENCKHKYRIYRRFNNQKVQFIDEQDFVLFQMIWG